MRTPTPYTDHDGRPFIVEGRKGTLRRETRIGQSLRSKRGEAVCVVALILGALFFAWQLYRMTGGAS